MTSTAPMATRRAHPALVEALALGGAAVVLRVPALFAVKHLTFDDGVFGASAVAMRNGGVPFRDVFSSQGPLFLPLVRLFDVLGLQWISAPRLLNVTSGVALTLAAWWIARRHASADAARVAGIAAGLLVATSGSVLWVTAPIAADGPAMAFATWAVACALEYRRAPSRGLALAVGLLGGAAFAIKSLLVVPTLLVAAVVVLLRKQWRDVVIAGAVALVLNGVLVVAFGVRDVWEQWFLYHLDHAGTREPLANLRKIGDVFVTREWILLVVGVVTAIWALVRRRDVRGLPIDRVLAWWIGMTLVVLLMQTPMWRPHVMYLTVPLAILVACHLPPWRVAVVAALVAAVPWAIGLRSYLWPRDYTGEDAAVVAAIRALPKGAQAISDEPGLIWRAPRDTPGWMVDASMLRVDSTIAGIRLDADEIGKYASRRDVCLVAVTSGRYADLRGLPARLESLGYERRVDFGDDRAVWIKAECTP